MRKRTVLVQAIKGINVPYYLSLKQTKKGDVRYEVESTAMFGRGMSYQILQINRSGIRSILGRPLNTVHRARASSSEFSD